MTDKDINIHAKGHGFDEMKRNMDELAKETEAVGDASLRAGIKADEGGKKVGGVGKQAGKTSGAMRVLGKVVGSLKGQMTGLASLGMFIAFLKKWFDWVKKIDEAQKELVKSTKELDEVSKSLASQANVMGTEEGMEGARKQVLAIQEAGNTSFGLAGSVAVAAHSAFGTSGKLLSPGEQDIAGVVAGFAQRKDLTEGEAGQLLKLLSAMGVKDAAGARGAVQDLSTVQQASQAQSFGEFVGGATDAMITQKALGATDEFGLASYAMGLDIDGGPQAATKIEQMSAHLQNEKVVEAIARESGISGSAFRELPYDQRVGMFSAWISKHSTTGAGQQYLIKSGLSGDQVGEAMSLYTAERLKRREMFMGLAEDATGEQFMLEAGGYANTTQGQIEALDSARERFAASASPDERIGLAMLETSVKQWGLMDARGQVGHYGTSGLEDRDRIRKLVRTPLLKRMYAIPYGPEREKIAELLNANPVSIANPFTAGEIGEAERLLQDAEQKYSGQFMDVEDMETGPSVAPGYSGQFNNMEPYRSVPRKQSVTVNNNYHHDYSMHYPMGTREEQGRGGWSQD